MTRRRREGRSTARLRRRESREVQRTRPRPCELVAGQGDNILLPDPIVE